MVEASQTIGKASTDLANDSKALSGIAEDLVEKFRDLGEFREAMVGLSLPDTHGFWIGGEIHLSLPEVYCLQVGERK